MEEYTVYVQVNEGACVVAVNSSAFLTQTEGWVEVETDTTTPRATIYPSLSIPRREFPATSWKTALWWSAVRRNWRQIWRAWWSL